MEFYYLMADVDENGYLLPLGMLSRMLRGEALPGQPEPTLRQRAELRLSGSQSLFKGIRYSLLACGELSADEYNALVSTMNSRSGNTEEYPIIPAWLGEHPPYQTVFLPNGDILCYGELDLHFEQAPQSSLFILSSTHWPPRLTWYRYSSAGELLGKSIIENDLDGSDWQQLYYSHQPAKNRYLGSAGSRDCTDYSLGYQLEFNETREQVKGDRGISSQVVAVELKSATDWQGQPVDLDAPPPVIPAGYLAAIFRESLAVKYQSQVKSGKADPSALSPFAGQPNGPQLADPAPRPLPLFARLNVNGEPKYVLVKEMDDPANPFREQYQPWDYWLRTRIGKDYYLEPGVYETATKLHDAALKNAEASGDEEAIEQARNEPLNLNPPEDWEYFSLSATADGYIMPYLQSPDVASEWLTGDWGSTPRECYQSYLGSRAESAGQVVTLAGSLVANGAMPAEIKQQFLQEKWDSRAWQYPEVPAWLFTQLTAPDTFDNVLLLRDGRCVLTCITYELEPEALDADTIPKHKITGRITLFAADGTEIQHFDVSTTEYAEVPQERDVLFPGYRALAEQTTAAGQSLVEIPGRCLVLLDGELFSPYQPDAPPATDLPQPIAAFTLTGAPLGLDEPIPGELTAVHVSMKDARELFEAQQRVAKP